MADLYGTNARSSSLESEDMSSLLRNLLHNSFTSPPSSSTSLKDKHKQSFISPSPPPPLGYTDCRFREGISTAGSSVMVDSLTGFNFSDPGRGLRVDAEECTRNMCSSVCAVDSDGLTSTLKRKFPAENDAEDFGFDCKGTEVSEAPVDPSPPRSSKRSRAAEFHNLSEQRRRSKINEKVKALQSLIPNSNKTDKASVLDEAIEYLKQLQQQVQMLSMRNGQSLYPFCLSGSLHPTQMPQPGIGFDEGNELSNAKGEYTFFGNRGVSMQAAFDLPNQCSPLNQPNLISAMTNIRSSDTSFVLESSVQNHYGLFNHLTSSKEIFRGDRLSLLQLDMSCSPKNSSSGVSS